MLFLGVDWAEAHHDFCLMSEDGAVLAKRRIPDTLAGARELHECVAHFVDDPSEVIVGIEKDRGLIVTSLTAARYRVHALNPLSVARYRTRHVTSGAKSDPADAKLLAEIVRVDRSHHQEIAPDSDLAEGMKVLARAHQGAIWTKVRETNALRNALKDFYPGALDAFNDLSHRDALSVLALAPTPSLGATLSRHKIAAALRRGGRQRNIDRRTQEIYEALRFEQLHQPLLVENAFGEVVRSQVAIVTTIIEQIASLESAVTQGFEQHPDAGIIHSLPGMGMVLGARVLAEFGDAPNRYVNAQSRKNYAGTSPITKSSGKSHVALARHVRNRRLIDAWDQVAFCSLSQSSGARAYYDELRARGKTHRQATRQLANRLVGIYHHLIETRSLYDEGIAWKQRENLAA